MNRPVRAWRVAALALLAASTLAACGNQHSDEFADIFGDLGDPLPTATAAQLAAFERGREVALRRFTDSDGLGPEFNVVSCRNCHERPVLGGSAGRYRDFLLVGQRLIDGSFFPTGVAGVQPQFTLTSASRRPTDPGTNVESTRNPIPMFGVGVIAALPEASILAHVDEDDADGDGISGRANFDRGFVGRFGRKAQTVSIEGFIRGPLFNHMGITTDPLSDERKAALPVPSALIDERAARPGIARLLTSAFEQLVAVAYAQVAAPEEPNFDFDGVPDPEMSEQDLFDIVSFAMLLAAPRPDPPTPVTLAGRARFDEFGCAGCHVPALPSDDGLVPAFSDFLLHDMGEELADGIPQGLASESEFRTQPLWGVAATGPYLHDGRADTIDQAIRMHGGEAQAAADAYTGADPAARDAVIAFLESLGGAEQRSEGLVPPGTPIAAVGEPGGPARPLTFAEEELFLRGRDLFDRDFPLDDGLGPVFNGDSCRACHFDPAIGGAGPEDVDVVRHGTLVGDDFTAPDGGTIAHRFSTTRERPDVDGNANFFELRQPPSCFGLGFLESVPEEDILANENCDDPDPTAISGCAHFLATGELGRLGWKAQVPSLAEFARDAMTAELGMTVADVPGMTFGATADDDGVADPEIDAEDLEAIAFFMRQLAAPRGNSSDPLAEAAGELLFDQVGCTGCHVTDFVTDDGIVAYTDLLLHQVAADGDGGIEDGGAEILEFRTPPLWGLPLTAPYMHDGRSFTVEHAIERHEAEAAASRDAYLALDEQGRADLLAFLASL